MAREAGGRAQQNKNCDVEYLMSADALKAFEALVRADAIAGEREQGQKWFDAVTAQHKAEILAEREACAKVCEELVPDMSRIASEASVWDVATFDCATAIRERSANERARGNK
jgi:hypothetical protein